MIFVLFALLVPETVFPASWPLPGWTYRKSHAITGSTGAGTNYQVRVVVHKTTGTDSGPDVYLGSNVRDDFGDVRFTAGDASTVLSYWLEGQSLTSGSQAAFWINVTADLGTNQNVYIYYGNSSATTNSNGTNTFLLYSDWEDQTLQGWTINNAGGSGSGSVVSLNSFWQLKLNAPSTSARVQAFKAYSAAPGIMIESIMTTGTTAGDGVYIGFSDGTMQSASEDASQNGYMFSLGRNGNTADMIQKTVASAFTTLATTAGSVANSTTYYIGLSWTGTTLKGYRNRSQILSATDNSYSSRSYAFISADVNDKYYDWIYVRKYINPEPANSTWGAEENVYSFDYTWGVSGWTYRKCHTVNSATGAGTNYQVAVTVFYGNGTDNGSNIYCNSHCQNDFSDIRFTAADGSTQLSYWLQSYTSGTSAVFWVKISADLTTNQLIYIYYGKSGVSTTSNAANTFIFFDDGSSVGSWTVNGTAGSTAGQGNPQPSYYANGASGNYLNRNAGLTTSTLTTFNVYTQTGNLGNFYFLCSSGGSGQMYRIDSRGSTNYSGFATTTNWTTWAAPASGFNATALAWYKFAVAVTSSTSATLYYQQTTDATPGLPSITLGTFTVSNNGGYIGLVGDGGGASLVTYLDNIITRKYVNPEPTQSGCSSEETVLLASTTPTNILCYAYSTGSVVSSVSGGSSPYTYSWNNSRNTETITGLSAGSYMLTVTDLLGQAATSSSSVTQPTAVSVSSTPVNITCYGASTGSITLSGSGGTPAYQYSINNGNPFNQYPAWQSSGSFTGLPSGQFKVRAKDNNGCMSPLMP